MSTLSDSLFNVYFRISSESRVATETLATIRSDLSSTLGSSVRNWARR